MSRRPLDNGQNIGSPNSRSTYTVKHDDMKTLMRYAQGLQSAAGGLVKTLDKIMREPEQGK